MYAQWLFGVYALFNVNGHVCTRTKLVYCECLCLKFVIQTLCYGCCCKVVSGAEPEVVMDPESLSILCFSLDLDPE